MVFSRSQWFHDPSNLNTITHSVRTINLHENHLFETRLQTMSKIFDKAPHIASTRIRSAFDDFMGFTLLQTIEVVDHLVSFALCNSVVLNGSAWFIFVPRGVYIGGGGRK